MNAGIVLLQIIKMKKFFVVLLLFSSVTVWAQNKDEIAVLANTRSLFQTVFGSKDSVTLEKLFAKELSYGHSGGKLENRQQALQSIVHNASTYANQEMGPVQVWIKDKTAVTRHTMSANETTKDGKVNALKLHLMLVWVKEKGGWKLIARQAVKVQ